MNSTEIDLVFAYNCTESDTKDYAQFQRRATNKQANSRNFKKLVELTYGDVPFQQRVNREKFALIDHLQKSKKGDRLTITAYSCTKI